MESNRDGKRKKSKHSNDDENQRETKSKRARSKSRSPAESRGRERRKRRHSKSRSPDISVKHEKSNIEPELKKEAPERKRKETDMLNTRTGGAYIPPARLRMMQAQITDKASVAYQRLAWEALKKSIHGHINKINVGNIGIIIKQLLKENIIRGRGLLCRSVIQAQAASPTFTNVYAALVAAVNSRFPKIGELLLKRLVIQFKRGFKRNDKSICISSAAFIAHLVNQRVAHEILALELLTLLVETPTDDSVEVSIAFLKECGQKLTEVSSKGVNAIFEMLRNILHEGQLDKRVQYMIEVMFQIWKDGFKDHPALIEELELVPEEEQYTHLLMLDEATDSQDILNVFKFDDKFEENEQKYKELSNEILGSDAESGEEDDESGESGSDASDAEEGEQTEQQGAVTIIDNTETNLIALRRTIYLTINSSLDFEECAHKLMKMQLKPGQEVELCHMFLDCCAEQRTYEKFYGLLAQRFCNINRIYIGPFEDIFKDSYATAHRLDTNRLRNVSKFFAHLLFTDSISWEVMECVKLNEEDTTSSSRIYIKILFQELAEYMGLKKLNDRLKDPTLQGAFSGVFPRDNPKNTRFSINFFTSIGLGGLTDELREHLKQMPKNVPAAVTEIKVDSSSSSSSDSSSDSSSSSSDSEEDSDKDNQDKAKKKKKATSKDKEVEKSTEKNKDNDRWGHDGFYDTYGKDARRTETRPERDSDNFAIPRDVQKRNDNSRRDNQRNGDEFRRRDDRNRDDDRYNRQETQPRRTDSRRDRDDDEFRNRHARQDRNDDRQRRSIDDRSIRNESDNKKNREGENDERSSDKLAIDQRDRKSDKVSSRRERDDEYDRDRREKENRHDKSENRTSRRDRSDEDNEKEKRDGNSQKSRNSYSTDKRDRKSDKVSSHRERDQEYDKERHDKENRHSKPEKRTSRRGRSYEDVEKDSRDRDVRKQDKKRHNESESENSDSSNEDRSNKKKNKRSKNKEKRRNNNESSDDDSSSNDDRKKRKDDGWDIRGSSIRKEVGGRYWDTQESRKARQTPEKSERRHDRRREVSP